MPRRITNRSTTARDSIRADLDRLDELRFDPEARFALALEYVARSSNLELLRRVLPIVQDAADEQSRPVLHRAFGRSDARNDSGGFIRAGIIRALRPIVHPDDLPLLEQGLQTYQLVGLYDTTSELRAASLLALNDLDPDQAALHAARFLADPHNGNSGDPALSSLRILAAQQNLPPVFAFAYWKQAPPSPGGAGGDLHGEALRLLVDLPERFVWQLVEAYRESEDEQELLGLYDLLLAHPARSNFRPVIEHFLRTTGLLDLYGLVAMQVVVSRDDDLISLLRDLEATEADHLRRGLLRQALEHA